MLGTVPTSDNNNPGTNYSPREATHKALEQLVGDKFDRTEAEATRLALCFQKLRVRASCTSINLSGYGYGPIRRIGVD